MRSITLRPGESITIGDTAISAEHSDLKSGSAAARTSAIGGGYIGIPGLSLRDLVQPGEPVLVQPRAAGLAPLDDLRPILNEILATGVKQADVARRLGIKAASVSEALNSGRPWMPTYANGVRLMQLHREVCGGEGGDA